MAYLNCDSGVVYNQVPRVGASPLMYDVMYESAKVVSITSVKPLSCYTVSYVYSKIQKSWWWWCVDLWWKCFGLWMFPTLPTPKSKMVGIFKPQLNIFVIGRRVWGGLPRGSFEISDALRVHLRPEYAMTCSEIFCSSQQLFHFIVWSCPLHSVHYVGASSRAEGQEPLWHLVGFNECRWICD